MLPQNNNKPHPLPPAPPPKKNKCPSSSPGCRRSEFMMETCIATRKHMHGSGDEQSTLDGLPHYHCFTNDTLRFRGLQWLSGLSQATQLRHCETSTQIQRSLDPKFACMEALLPPHFIEVETEAQTTAGMTLILPTSLHDLPVCTRLLGWALAGNRGNGFPGEVALRAYQTGGAQLWSPAPELGPGMVYWPGSSGQTSAEGQKSVGPAWLA